MSSMNSATSPDFDSLYTPVHVHDRSNEKVKNAWNDREIESEQTSNNAPTPYKYRGTQHEIEIKKSTTTDESKGLTTVDEKEEFNPSPQVEVACNFQPNFHPTPI